MAPIAELRGPFASLYMETDPTAIPPALALEKRWKIIRHQLGSQGAGKDVLEAIDGQVDHAYAAGRALGVIAHRGGVVHAAHHPQPPPRDIAVFASLPRLALLLEWRQAAVPYLVVRVDRIGADITVVGDRGVRETTVEGETFPITKVHAGGWSERQYQHRVENTWEANAKEVADQIVALVDDVNAEVVVVAGDVRAVELLRDALPDRVATLVRVVDGGRHDDGSDDELAESVARYVGTVAAAETATILRKFHEERGQHDRAADGPARTLEALARAQVETLLIHDDPDDERTAWFGPAPEHVGSDRATVTAMGVDEPETGRLIDVAIRAALGTGAGVWIVPRAGGPTGSVGAILRWT